MPISYLFDKFVATFPEPAIESVNSLVVSILESQQIAASSYFGFEQFANLQDSIVTGLLKTTEPAPTEYLILEANKLAELINTISNDLVYGFTPEDQLWPSFYNGLPSNFSAGIRELIKFLHTPQGQNQAVIRSFEDLRNIPVNELRGFITSLSLSHPLLIEIGSGFISKAREFAAANSKSYAFQFKLISATGTDEFEPLAQASTDITITSISHNETQFLPVGEEQPVYTTTVTNQEGLLQIGIRLYPGTGDLWPDRVEFNVGPYNDDNGISPKPTGTIRLSEFRDLITIAFSWSFPQVSAIKISDALLEASGLLPVERANAVIAHLNTVPDRPFQTLADIRKIGGFHNSPVHGESSGLSSQLKEDLRLLDRLSYYELINSDLSLTELIGLSKNINADVTALATMPRNEVVQDANLGSLIGDFRAFENQQVGTVVATINHNIFSGVIADVVNTNQQNASLAPVLQAAFENKCNCEECLTAVSPMAYLFELLNYTLSYLREGDTPFSLTSFSDKMKQDFGAIPATCHILKEQVYQARLAIEVLLREYSVNAVSSAKQNFVNKAYSELLEKIGTNSSQLLNTINGLPSEQSELIERLGFDPVSHVNVLNELQLIQSPAPTDKILDEINLERVFGFKRLTSNINLNLSNATEYNDLESCIDQWYFENVRFGYNTDENGKIFAKIRGGDKIEFYKIDSVLTNPAFLPQYLVAESSGISVNSSFKIVPVNNSGLTGYVRLGTSLRNSDISYVVIPLVLSRKTENLRKLWALQDSIRYQTKPIIDPDVLVPSDFANPTSTVAGSSIDLYLQRKQVLDAKKIQLNDTKTTGESNQVDRSFTLGSTTCGYLTIDAQDRVYISDQSTTPSQRGIRRVDTNTNGIGGVANNVWSVGSDTPQGIALFKDQDMLLVACEGSNKIKFYTTPAALDVTTTVLLGEIGMGPGTKIGQIGGPRGLVCDTKGDIWLSESGNKRIQQFPKPVKKILSNLDVASKMAQSGSGRIAIAVVSANLHKVFIYDEGKFDQASLVIPDVHNAQNPGQTKDLRSIHSLAFDQDQNLFIASKNGTGPTTVRIFNSQGLFISENTLSTNPTGTPPANPTGTPVSLKIDPQGKMHILFPEEARIREYGVDLTQSPVAFNLVATNTFNSTNCTAKDFVLDQANNYIIVFDITGTGAGSQSLLWWIRLPTLQQIAINTISSVSLGDLNAVFITQNASGNDEFLYVIKADHTILKLARDIVLTQYTFEVNYIWDSSLSTTGWLGFQSLSSLVVTEDQEIITTSGLSNSLHLISPNKVFSQGSITPDALSIDPQGHLVFVDRTPNQLSIKKLSPTENKVLWSLPFTDLQTTAGFEISYVYCDYAGDIYAVSNGASGTMYKLDRNGQLIGSWTHSGMSNSRGLVQNSHGNVLVISSSSPGALLRIELTQGLGHLIKSEFNMSVDQFAQDWAKALLGQAPPDELVSLNLDFLAYKFIMEVLQLTTLKRPVDTELWNQVYDILIQRHKEKNLYGTWKSEENTGGFKSISDLHFKALPMEEENAVTLNRWRSSIEDRVDFRDAITARIGQYDELVKSYYSLVAQVEEETIGSYRDDLIQLFTIPGRTLSFSEKAQNLEDKYLVDMLSAPCKKTNRVAQAMETLQTLLWTIRTGQSEIAPALSIVDDHFDDNWKWMGSYASWRSARFVNLFPENYLYSEFVQQKSGAFRTLIEDMSSSRNLSEPQICHALKQYTDYMKEVSNLELLDSLLYDEGMQTEFNCQGQTTQGQTRVFILAKARSSGRLFYINEAISNLKIENLEFWEPIEQIPNDSMIAGLAFRSNELKEPGVYLFYKAKEENEINYMVYNISSKIWGKKYKVSVDKVIIQPNFQGNGFSANLEKLLSIKVVNSFDEKSKSIQLICSYYTTLDSAGAALASRVFTLVYSANDEWIYSDYSAGSIRAIFYNGYNFFRFKHFNSSVTINNDKLFGITDRNSPIGRFAIEPSISSHVSRDISPVSGFNLVIGAIAEGKRIYLIFTEIPNSTNPYGINLNPGSINIHVYDFERGLNVSISHTIPVNTSSGFDVSNGDVGTLSKDFDYIQRVYYFNQKPTNFSSTTLENYPKLLLLESKGKIEIAEYAFNLNQSERRKKLEIKNVQSLNPTYPSFDLNLQHIDKVLTYNPWISNYATQPVNQKYNSEAFYHLPVFVASRLHKLGQYEESLNWWKKVFDFTQSSPSGKFTPIFLKTTLAISSADDVQQYIQDTLDPHAIAGVRTHAYDLFLENSVIQCLLDYADSLFAKDSNQSVAQARELYKTAIQLLNKYGNSYSTECESLIANVPLKLANTIWEGENRRVIQMLGKIGKKEDLIATIIRINNNTDNPSTDVECRSYLNTVFGLIKSMLLGRSEATEFGKLESKLSSVLEKLDLAVLTGNLWDETITEVSNQVREQVRTSVANRYGFTQDSLLNTGNSISFLRSKPVFLPVNSEVMSLTDTSYRGNATISSSFYQDRSFDYQAPTQQNISTQQVLNNPTVYLKETGGIGPMYFPPLAQYVFCTPDNPVRDYHRLRAEVNLFKIRNCMNLSGFRRELDPFGAPTDAVSGLPGVSLGGGITLGNFNIQPSLYRYSFLIERSKQLASMAQQMESVFLSLLEKYDSERYSQLKARQEIGLARESIKLQDIKINEARLGVTLSQLQKDRANIQFGYFDNLLRVGLLAEENNSLNALKSAQDLALQASNSLAWAAGLNATSSSLSLLAQSVNGKDAIFSAGTANVLRGFAAASALAAGVFAVRGQLKSGESQFQSFNASIFSQSASYERRRQDWEFQKNLAQQDQRIGDQQIRISEARVNVVAQEKQISELQMSHAEDTLEFITSKFTNAELYAWMSSIMEGVYAYFLNEATANARLAFNQLAFERQELPQATIRNSYWTIGENPGQQAIISGNESGDDRRGLTGSSRLLRDIYKLEQFAIDTDQRKLQLSKTISLASLSPADFQQFRETGRLIVSTPMEMFDRDFPGHYLRLIRKVKVSVIGLIPTTGGINATLTNTGISRVVSGKIVFSQRTIQRSPESIVFNNAIDATGSIELNPQDNKLNPFEGLGVDTSWFLELPKASNFFDFNTLADVLLTIEYSALDNAEYRLKVIERLGTKVNRDLAFSFKLNYPDQWYDLNNALQTSSPLKVKFDIDKFDFPANLKNIKTSHITMMIVRKDGESFELDIILNKLVQPVVGGQTRTYGGRSSTRTGAMAWIAMTSIDPVGTYELEIKANYVLGDPATFTQAQIIQLFAQEKIEDIFLVISYKGDAPSFITALNQ